MTFTNLMGGILFGTIGMVAFGYGKKQCHFKAMGIGVALMVYPYFIPNTIAMYLVGIALTAALFIFHD